MYGAQIMYGANKFAVPGAVTNVRNSFSAGAGLYDKHNVTFEMDQLIFDFSFYYRT